MKKYYNYCLLFLSFLVSCQVNPLKDIEEGDWNNEKRILRLRFENQAGDAVIGINVDNLSFGFVDVTIVNPDLSKPLKINELEVSYNAVASVNAGEDLRFDPITNSSKIIVTSASGENREYVVRVTPLEEILIGKWQITEMNVFGGTGADYGGVDFLNMIDDPSWWNTETGVNAEFDNVLEFTFEGVTDDGKTFGKCENLSGGDAKYADFVWAAPLPDGQTVTDVNYNYRKIPKGESKWERDYIKGTIKFFQGDFISEAKLENSGIIEFWGKNLVIHDKALNFGNLRAVGGWGPIYTPYDKLVYAPWNFYVQITKL